MKKLLYGFLISLLLIQNVFSAIPVVFTNGTTADATEVNQNFNYFENKFSTTSGHDHDGSDSRTLSTLGTITTGTWQGSIIGGTYGGTGHGTYASGDMVYATADTGLARLAKGTIGSVLSFGATKSEPEWIAPGTSGQFLQTKGSGANPAWVAGGSLYVGSFTRDTTVASGTQAVTGVGFTPRAVIFISLQASTKEASWGFDIRTLQQSFGRDATADVFLDESAYSIANKESSTLLYSGEVSSFDSDGFTITWTRNSTPTGTLIVQYLAFI